nr:immunoglobulin light chain junction region [Macaca mulatta]
CQHGNHMPFTF